MTDHTHANLAKAVAAVHRVLSRGPRTPEEVLAAIFAADRSHLAFFSRPVLSGALLATDFGPASGPACSAMGHSPRLGTTRLPAGVPYVLRHGRLHAASGQPDGVLTETEEDAIDEGVSSLALIGTPLPEYPVTASGLVEWTDVAAIDGAPFLPLDAVA